jgi:BTB/POZ domain
MEHASIKFNVGGKMFEVNRSLLTKCDDKMMLRVAAEMSDPPNEPIFIDRDSELFVYVLDYIRDGKVSVPISISKESFISDLVFYGIDVIDTNVNISGSCASHLKLCMLNHNMKMSKNKEKTIRLQFRRECRIFAKCCLEKIVTHMVSLVPCREQILQVHDALRSYSLNDDRKKQMEEIFSEYGFTELDFKKWPVLEMKAF